MINRTVLVGRLTKDPEVRKTQSGKSVCQVTVACDRNRKKDENSQEPTADFISCVIWNQPADFLGQYARKGALIGVDGRLQSRSYDRDGQRVYVTEVVADNVRLLESRAQSESRAQQGNNGYQDSYQAPYGQPSYAQPSYSQPAYNDNAGMSDDFGGSPLDISSDDLPY